MKEPLPDIEVYFAPASTNDLLISNNLGYLVKYDFQNHYRPLFIGLFISLSKENFGLGII